MKLNEAIEILESFNAYRRYRGEDMPPLPASATDIGIALDVAIAALKTPISISSPELIGNVREIHAAGFQEYEYGAFYMGWIEGRVNLIKTAKPPE
jgi:hypothetical protein